MQHYCLGFAFDDLGRVALIEKQRPEWQRGLLNGIGGKVEFGETPIIAMHREFFEETGVSLPSGSWHSVGRMTGPKFVVHVFTAAHPNVRSIRTVERESVALFTEWANIRCIENVPALIALCKIPEEQRPAFLLEY